MSGFPAEITPVPRSPNDHAATAVHAHLRSLILKGALPPGSILNQVDLAPRLGVSRTPLREAIRMLQEEGLVEAEPQRRARVIGFDPGDLEAVYVQRILFEGLAGSVTAATAEAEKVGELEELLAVLRRTAVDEDVEPWQIAHKRFHLAVTSGVRPSLQRVLRNNIERSDRYILLGQASEPRNWFVAGAGHEAIVSAFAERNGSAVSSHLGSHLAMAALSLIAHLAPTYDPAALRGAAAAVGAGSAGPDATVSKTRRVAP